MLSLFSQHIATRRLFTGGNSLLLAISGGVDSVVLAHLLKNGGYNFALAHCNFKLRGADSDADESFCRQLAQELQVPIHVKVFDVEAYRKPRGLSIQMAARELRYAWFNDILASEKIDYLLTAHHGSDVVETLFINLMRGTGVNGLKGIAEKSGQLVRPLLPFTKQDIAAYAETKGLAYRTDKSNQEAKYERNFLRLYTIPGLKKLHPNLEQTVLNNANNFREEAGMVQEFLQQKADGLMKVRGGLVYIHKPALKKEKHLRSLLHFMLQHFGFNATQLGDLEQHLLSNGLVGKIIASHSHVLTIDREQLVIKKKEHNAVTDVLQLHSLKELGKVPGMGLEPGAQFKKPALNELLVEKEKLVFPLTIRPKNRGDKFKPFGMKGFKLLSDFLKEQKLNTFEKESCRLLVNGNGDIIWVLGYRSDERYKVNTKHSELIKLTLLG